MRKIYLDTTQSSMCISVYAKDSEVVLAGTTINSMSVKEKCIKLYKNFTNP
jgi:hypothetical protein